MAGVNQDMHIGRLKLHTTKRRAVTQQIGLRQTLHQVRYHPAHLPTSAILIIRRLHELPSYASHSTTSARWQRHLEHQLTELARRAAQPGRQSGWRDAESILFRDASEMLACYTRDMLTHHHPLPWYWHELFPQLSSTTSSFQIVSAWGEYPHALPAALVQLQPTIASQAMGTVNPPDMLQLAQLLHQTFNLPKQALLAMSEPATATPFLSDSVQLPQVDLSPPWRDWMPNQAATGLAPSADYILGLCYGLVRRPQLIRTESFTTATVRWFQTALRDQRPNHETSAPLAPTSRLTRDLPPNSRESAVTAAHHMRWGTGVDLHSGTSARPTISAAALSPPQPSSGSDITAFTHHPAETTQLATTVLPLSPHADQVLDRHKIRSYQDDSIATGLGGAFYLVNLFTRLQLPWGIDALTPLSPWELLGAITADLLGPLAYPYQNDALWGLLRALAQLDPDEPWGAMMTQLDHVEVPPDWLSRIGITSMGIEDDRAFLPKESSLETLSPLATAQTAPALVAWLVHIRRSIHAVLHHMLRNPARPIETVLAKPAQLVVTHTHIDVHMPLDAVDIDVRRSGLDQNPGWVPEFGYIVTFHFQSKHR